MQQYLVSLQHANTDLFFRTLMVSWPARLPAPVAPRQVPSVGPRPPLQNPS